jgi:hypothetical protein
MRSPIRRHPYEQLDLFHATRQSPTWQTLSAEVRERTMPLLARLLREHLVRHLGHDVAREVGDE